MTQRAKRKWFKFLIWNFSILFGLILLSATLSLIIVEYKKDWLVEEIENFIDKQISGNLLIGNIEVLPLSKIGSATIGLSNVQYFDKKGDVKPGSQEPT